MENIKLEDVLEGNHLSPFTLAEFENHLINSQHSVENLYFYFWLIDYTNRYRKWQVVSQKSSIKYEGSGAPISRDTDQSMQGRGAPGMRRRSMVQLIHIATMQFFSKTKQMQQDLSDRRVLKDQNFMSSNWMSSTTSLGFWKPSPNDTTKLPKDLLKSFHILKSFIIRPNSSDHNPVDPSHEEVILKPSLSSSASKSSSSGFNSLNQTEYFELNISQDLGLHFFNLAQNSYDPHIFSCIKSEVLHMLSDSMNTWILDYSTTSNSAQKPSRWTTGIGLFCIVVAIIGTLMIEITGTSWKTGFFLTPIFSIGMEMMICGVCCTCPLIFIFAEVHLCKLSRAEIAATRTKQKLLSGSENFYLFEVKQPSLEIFEVSEKSAHLIHHPTDNLRSIHCKSTQDSSESKPMFRDSTHPASLIDFWDSQLEKNQTQAHFLNTDLREDNRSSAHTMVVMNVINTADNNHTANGPDQDIVHPTDLKCSTFEANRSIMQNRRRTFSLHSTTRFIYPITIEDRRTYHVKSVFLACFFTLLWIFCFSFIHPYLM